MSGAGAEAKSGATPPKTSAYSAAGVDIDAQERALGGIADLVRSTHTAGVLSELGSFGGLFAPPLEGVESPVLVSSADGVGTKLEVAKRRGDFSTVGHDLVNHCVNDILVQGAEPLFFLDYVGAGVLDPESFRQLVAGVAAGCRENRCALLGGETAEMPGFYRPGDYELVGFVVGMADRAHLLDGSRVGPGDVILGLHSSGLHTNGYSLARRVLFDDLALDIDDPVPGLDADRSVGDHLLAIHRSYLEPLRPLLRDPGLHALAHITGGGLSDNVPRILPEGARARVDLGSWTPPPLFSVLARHGGVEDLEMLRVFNLGVGMVAIVDRESVDSIVGHLRESGERPWILGEVVSGESGIEYRGALEHALTDGL